MKIGYYPGCTLKAKAENLNESAIKSLAALGFELTELERWNCCGAVYNLADDDLIHFLAPIRDLIQARDEGYGKLVTLCSMCYNTLARANLMMREDSEKRDALNSYLADEDLAPYTGDVEVVHLLPFLRDEIGWDALREKVTQPLEGLKLAPYYGCTLTRPTDIGIDEAPTPQVFEDFLAALGATPVTFSAAETCCGSYNIVSNPEAAMTAVAGIVANAGAQEADAMAMSCPLCEYNLGRRQQEALAESDAAPLPTFYFTQLLALALGLGPEAARFDMNPENSRKLLEERGLSATA